MLNMYITHPRMTWQVKNIQSPALIFFSENNSLRLDKSLESQVRNN